MFLFNINIRLINKIYICPPKSLAFNVTIIEPIHIKPNTEMKTKSASSC